MPTHIQNSLQTAIKELKEVKDLAAHFKSLGIKGKRHDCSKCVLAVYLSSVVGEPVLSDGEVAWVESMYGDTACRCRFKAFTDEFDAGEYPELEA